MAWRVQCGNLDALANHERLAVLRRLCDCLTVLAANDRKSRELRQDLGVAAGVVPVVVGVDNRRQIDFIVGCELGENRGDLWWVRWVDDD